MKTDVYVVIYSEYKSSEEMYKEFKCCPVFASLDDAKKYVEESYVKIGVSLQGDDITVWRNEDGSVTYTHQLGDEYICYDIYPR